MHQHLHVLLVVLVEFLVLSLHQIYARLHLQQPFCQLDVGQPQVEGFHVGHAPVGVALYIFDGDDDFPGDINVHQ